MSLKTAKIRRKADDVSLKNNYSGQIYVTAKDAFGVKVGKNAAKTGFSVGDRILGNGTFRTFILTVPFLMVSALKIQFVCT